MLFIVGLILLFIAYYLFRKQNSYIAPTVIIAFVWGLILLGYDLISHGMYTISIKTGCVLCIWIFSSLIGAYIFSFVKVPKPKLSILVFNPSIRSTYFWISVLGCIPLFYIAYKQGTTMEAGFLFNLRMANTGLVETEYKYGIFQYVFAFAFISLLIESYSSDKTTNRVRILFVINILLAIITMAKSSFFFVFISLLSIKILQRDLPVRKIVPIFVFIIILMVSVQLMRAGGDSEDLIGSMFNVYIFGGIPALDQIVNAETHTSIWGELTFRFFYTVQSSMTGIPIESGDYINNIFEDGNYVFIPYPTNVFTVIFPFWMDFGFLGVLIAGVLFGCFSGFIFKLAKQKRPWAVVLYSYIVAVLALPFFGEYIMTNLSYTIQLTVLLYIANVFQYKIKWL